MSSIDCNILQRTHFSETTVFAERQGELLGFVSGYRVSGYRHPKAERTYFLWQIGVHERGRGRRLPRVMIRSISARPA